MKWPGLRKIDLPHSVLSYWEGLLIHKNAPFAGAFRQVFFSKPACLIPIGRAEDILPKWLAFCPNKITRLRIRQGARWLYNCPIFILRRGKTSAQGVLTP